MNWNALDDYRTMMENKGKLKEEYAERKDLMSVKIAILAGATVGVLKEFLEVFLYQYGIRAEFLEGDYNRVYEEAVFDNQRLEEFKPDFIYIHMNNYNLEFDTQERDDINQIYEKLVQIWDSLYSKYRCYVIQNNFEYYLFRVIGNASRYLKGGLIYSVDEINRKISDYAEGHSWFLLNDLNYLSAAIGLEKWYNNNLWLLYKYPFDISVQPKIASNLASLIKSVYGKNKKAIITDLDNTLWKGIIGEIGCEKIEMGNETAYGEQFRKIQGYLSRLCRYGIILNICSKNDYETGISGLEKEGSLLKPEDFIVKKINWEDKYKNVKQILSEINLGEEAAVFIDDSAVECSSVQNFLAGISTVQVKNPQYLIGQIEDSHFFEVTHPSGEDRNREEYYHQNQLRETEQEKFVDYDEYLGSLGMLCQISGMNDNNIERIIQLSNKTNQFNLTNWRLNVQDADKIRREDNYITLSGKLMDKYGDNGIVSVIIAKYESNSAHILLWIMSCRVFKRGLEYAMWNEFKKECDKRGIDRIYGVYRKSRKNQGVREFYCQLGFQKVEEKAYEEIWVINDISNLPEIQTRIQIVRG